MTSTEPARAEPTGTTGTTEPWDVARVVALIGGLFFLGGGLWAMIDPEGFFDTLATFEPYNQHFLQDIGAFQLGLGAVLLLAVVWPRLDALAVGLLGVGFGSAAHVVSHAVGHDLGGTPEVDIPSLSILAGLLIVAGIDRLRRTR